MRELPDVPTLFELAMNDEQRQVLDLILASEEMARPLTAPPNVTLDRLQALRNAFSAMIGDDDFLAEGARLGLDLDPMESPEMLETINRLYSSSGPVVNAVRAVFEKAAR
jgi:hypothetical protein